MTTQWTIDYLIEEERLTAAGLVGLLWNIVIGCSHTYGGAGPADQRKGVTLEIK